MVKFIDSDLKRMSLHRANDVLSYSEKVRWIKLRELSRRSHGYIYYINKRGFIVERVWFC